jgi:hypothetical protein
MNLACYWQQIQYHARTRHPVTDIMSSKKIKQSSRQPTFHMSCVMWLFRTEPVSCGGQGAAKFRRGHGGFFENYGLLSERFSCDHFRPEPVARVQKNANFTAEPRRSPQLMEFVLFVFYGREYLPCRGIFKVGLPFSCSHKFTIFESVQKIFRKILKSFWFLSNIVTVFNGIDSIEITVIIGCLANHSITVEREDLVERPRNEL